jgi:Chaperone of endosialidase
VAVGWQALASNTTANGNVAQGRNALFSNTTGFANTANGDSALANNTIGIDNTACGQAALAQNTRGNSNIALGRFAGLNLTTGHENIDIANSGVAGESLTIRIGSDQTRAFIAGIRGVPIAGGQAVLVSSLGQLGSVASSARFKEEIKPMDKASEVILALKPVTFHYKRDLDPEGLPQFGLIAEEVERVNPDLVSRDEEGRAFTVRYEAVNAMLLNEFLKEHRRVEELRKDFQATVAQQQKEIQALTARLEEQATQIQR